VAQQTFDHKIARQLNASVRQAFSVRGDLCDGTPGARCNAFRKPPQPLQGIATAAARHSMQAGQHGNQWCGILPSMVAGLSPAPWQRHTQLRRGIVMYIGGGVAFSRQRPRSRYSRNNRSFTHSGRAQWKLSLLVAGRAATKPSWAIMTTIVRKLPHSLTGRNTTARHALANTYIIHSLCVSACKAKERF
jgi:hypothetical protein